ncbi:MAG TPA: helix-turn-helix domain-containing protein, partial [Bryobacteraceae bacterium]|nr:helix-turn-helix domain-containing protein [Bryobacteraceae bacterium]
MPNEQMALERVTFTGDLNDQKFARPDESKVLAELEQLVQSRVLRGAESLCKLLRYLVMRALERPGEPIKEYEIATELFGRPSNFDPRVDPAVRVQIGRLRSKLIEYYAGSGSLDELIVELPKGSHTPVFRVRPVVLPAPAGATSA